MSSKPDKTGFKDHFNKVIHNSTFRMVFLYFVLFILSSFILLSFIYWSTVSYNYEQLDHHIEYDMERLQNIYNVGGVEKLRKSIETSLKQKNYDSIYLLFNPDTKTILAGNLIQIPELEKPGWHIILLDGLTDNPQQKSHSARLLLMPLPGNLMLINGLDIESAHKQEHMIFNSLITGIAITLLLGAIGGFIISISTIKKINLINETINLISDGNLNLRIPLRGTDDDYDLLARNINEMLDQTHKLMQGIQNISNNIAHDLRTPLTRLRSRLEAIQQNCSAETSEGISQALLETDNLLTTFNAMLRINKLESGAQKGSFTQINIDQLLNDVVEFYEPLAEEKDLKLIYTGTSDNSEYNTIYADKGMIFQVFTNILDNAIKYTPEHGEVRMEYQCEMNRKPPEMVITIADTGKGIPAAERKKVLEPFYRLEKHRDKQGNGLGLSLVAAIIRLHKGRIEFKDNNPGLIVCISLPCTC